MRAFAKNNTQNSSPNTAVQKKGEDNFFGVQAKLAIGKANDKYETEADTVADKVVKKTQNKNTLFGGESFFPSKATPIQKSPFEEVQQKEETEEIQEKPLAETITPVVQLTSEDEEIQEKCAECVAEEKVQKLPFEDVQQKEDEEVVQEKCAECDTEEMVQKAGIVFPELPEVTEQAPATEATTENLEEASTEEAAPEGAEVPTPKGQITLPTPKKNKKERKEEMPLQTKSKNSNKSSSGVESQLKASKGGGSNLSQRTQQEMDSSFGANFSNVKIHTDSQAIQMNQQLGAHAFTNGNDIYFNEGKYNPETPSGKHLLAHELTHTIQQGASSTSIQKFAPEAKTVTPETAGEKPNDGAQVEGKANTKIDNDPNVEEGDDLSEEEKREKESPNRGEVHQEKGSVQAEGVSSPEVDRGSEAIEKTTTQKEELNSQVNEETPAAEEEAPTEGTKEVSNMAQADLAAQEATQAEQAALAVVIPATPQPFQHPDVSAPVDSAGEALPRQASIDTQVRGLGYIGEMLREKGYEVKQHAAEKEIHAHGMQAVIAKQKEDLALAKEGTSKIETQNEERKEISEKSKKALDESKQRQQFVATEAPGLKQEADEGKSDSSALASDANSKAAQSQSEIPDDPDARADGEQQAEEMNQTSDGAQSMDDAITQTGERAQQYIHDAETASEDNQQSETTISENDGIIAQIDGRTAEMNASNEASEASITNVSTGPDLVRQHSQRAAQSGEELIAASIVIETELNSIQEEYLASMASIESKEDAQKRVQEEQEQQTPEVSPQEQQLYELAALTDEEQQEQISQMSEEEKQGILATLDMTIANTPDNGTDATEGARTQVTTGWGQGLQDAQDTVVRFGLESQFGALGTAAADGMGLGVPDPGDPRAPRIQEVDNARAQRLSGVLDIADQNMSHLSEEQQRLLAERLVAESITDDIANINVLQMGRDMLIGMVNPAMALHGVVGGLEKTFSGVANIFNAEAWEKDPLGNLLQIAADISTGLAMVFSSILGIAGMITALMIALTIISWGTLSPVTGPVIGWMGTVMTYAGWGAIISGILAVYYNSLAYIKNLNDAGTAETARELFGNTEQMKQNASDGFQGAMAIVEGVGAVKMAPGMRSGQLLADLPPNPGAFARQTLRGAREGLSNMASLPARAARGARRLFSGGRQGLVAFKRKLQAFFRRADGPDIDSPGTVRNTTPDGGDLGNFQGRRVNAEMDLPDGHKARVLDDGQCAICSNCERIRGKYGEDLDANPDLDAELRGYEQRLAQDPNDVAAIYGQRKVHNQLREIQVERIEPRVRAMEERINNGDRTITREEYKQYDRDRRLLEDGRGNTGNAPDVERTPSHGAPGSPEHKAQRWQEYQDRGGEWTFERWEKQYEVNMRQARQANQAMDAYHERLGWGEREVTLDANGQPRRLDIADVSTQRGIEHKTGYQTANEFNLSEIARDRILMQNGWKIEWVFEGTASKNLMQSLIDAGIPFKFI